MLKAIDNDAEEALKLTNEEGDKLGSEVTEVEEQLKEAEVKLKRTEEYLASAEKTLKRKKKQLQLNIEMDQCEIHEFEEMYVCIASCPFSPVRIQTAYRRLTEFEKLSKPKSKIKGSASRASLISNAIDVSLATSLHND